MRLGQFFQWLFAGADNDFLKGWKQQVLVLSFALFISVYYLGQTFSSFRMSVYLFVLLSFVPVFVHGVFLKVTKDPLVWVVVVFGLYMAVTALWHEDNVDIFNKELRHLLLLVFFISGIALLQYRGNIIRYVQVVLFVVSALLSIISLVDFYSEHSFSRRLQSYGILANSAQLVYGLGLGFVCGMSLLLDVNIPRYRALVWIGLFWVLAAAILTGSRGGGVGITCVALGYAFFVYGWRVCVFLSLCLLSALCVWLMFGYDSLRMSSISARFEIWELLLADVKGRWLLGVGVDGRDLSTLLGDLGAHAHSLYFSVYYRGGVVGLALLCLLLLTMAQKVYRLGVRNSSFFLTAMLSFVLIVSIADLGDLFWRPTYLWMYFWLPIGLLLGESMRHVERQSQSVVNLGMAQFVAIQQGQGLGVEYKKARECDHKNPDLIFQSK